MMKTKYNKIRVVALCGSLRRGSYTLIALRHALEGAAELGAQTELIDLNNYELIFCKEAKDIPLDVDRLKTTISSADGIILGTPEYHGSYSGVLKNAIDLMGFDEFRGKMIGLIGVAGGAMGAMNALNHLRTVGRQLHAWVVPMQASIPNVADQFDNQGKLIDNKIRSRLRRVGEDVTRFAFLHRSDKIREFIENWESAPANPGGSSP